MENKPRNRGKHPSDDQLFNTKWQPIFKEAVADLSFLLSKNYGVKSATQLVGNRYRLNRRQQIALARMSAGDDAVAKRAATSVSAKALLEKIIDIDGFNVLILLESALSGAFIFKCKDQTYRDISSVHGSYKRVVQTKEAILMVGKALQEFQVEKVRWFLDAPISNSGRLKTMLLQIATEEGFPWTVDLDNNPDKILAESKNIVVSSDAWILDHTPQWFNLGASLIENKLPNAHIVFSV